MQPEVQKTDEEWYEALTPVYPTPSATVIRFRLIPCAWPRSSSTYCVHMEQNAPVRTHTTTTKRRLFERSRPMGNGDFNENLPIDFSI